MFVPTIPTDFTCFGGRLLRHAPNRWLWRDGVHERRVHEIATRLWNVPLRPHGIAGSGLVEMPFAHAQAYDPLRWVAAGCRDGRYDIDVSSVFPGMAMHAQGNGARGGVGSATAVTVALVPLDEWKSWRALCVWVPLWNAGDEAALFARARADGWTA